MSYAELIHRTWEHNVLFSALIELTYKCNLNCFYCYNDRELRGKTLSTDKYFRFFEDLRDMGVLHLVLSGGEPLMHPDFFTLGAKARQLGFVIRLKSNGHGLDRRTIKRIQQEADPFCIDISLHGASAAVHDRQTRVTGSFDILMENLQALRDLDQRFRLVVTLTAWNEKELESMFELADSFDVGLAISPDITPRDNGDLEPLSIAPSISAIKELWQLLKTQSDKKGSYTEEVEDKTGECLATGGTDKHCGAGSSTLAVDPFGNVMPCVQWRKAGDNLHDQHIANIWSQSEILQNSRRIAAEFTSNYDEEQGDMTRSCPALSLGFRP